MSASVICHGCGQRLDVPAGYPRRKMRCPHCGVMCELPDAARKGAPVAGRDRRRAAPADDVEDAAADVLFQAPAAPVAPACPECGADLPAEGGRVGACPRCARSTAVKAAADRTGLRSDGKPAARTVRREEAEEDDDEPYGVVGGLEDAKCPGCGQPLPPDAPLCVACGYNPRTGKKPPKVYTPIDRQWVPGLPFTTRLLLFIAFEALVVPLGLAGAILIDEVPGFIFCWLLATALAAFLLGTFDRVDLVRDKRGRIQLTKTWRVCFVPRPPERIRLSEHECVVTGRTREVDFWDWFVLFALVPLGLVPALVWYFYAIGRDSYQVALGRDHGFPETVLYRGWSEEHMRDIARAVSEAAEMPWDGG